MTKERDVFLTEAITGKPSVWCCSKCDWQSKYKNCDCADAGWSRYKFHTWDRFGLLWEWTQDQEWWAEFFVSKLTCRETDLININKLINPDRFANAVYEYLKDRR